MATFRQAIIITGGAGFIGSHTVRLFVNKYPETLIINLDKLTYAGNLENLHDIEEKENYLFVKGDISDAALVDSLFGEYPVTGVIHLAAESHVDRSITHPLEFIHTNIIGTVTLMNAARKAWGDDTAGKRFYQISTDEVYGSLTAEGYFTETTPYDPQSPYSASKAGADHFVRAYGNTFGLPHVITNCSNNYGPYQFPEKLIPLTINNIIHKKNIPVYGRGENIRDWLYVEDHAKAIDLVFFNGKEGRTYNIGGNNEWKNIDLVKKLCDITDSLLQRPPGSSRELITFVKDRAGHDLRYAIDSSRIREELGWRPATSFDEGLTKTVRWYLDNTEWLEHIMTGEYEKYYEQQYKKR
jgi:dTDP-glucose 4,6-dehydratase